MRLLINTASTFKGGGLQVAKSFIEECKKVTIHEYAVILGENLAKTIDIETFPKNFTSYKASFRPATKVFSLQSHNKFFKQIENEWKPDIVFTTSGPSYWRPKTPHVIGYNLPHYIYPESPYFKIIPLKNRIQWKLRKLVASYFFKRDADALVVQTDDVNTRVRKFLKKENVHTISNTISNYYTHPIKVPNKLPDRGNKVFRLLTLSAWYPHKNLTIIPKVIKELTKREMFHIQFIVTVPHEDFPKMQTQKNENQLINVGRVNVEEGASLYQECDAMFLPTLLECFSASYAEAMQLKKPIITSDLGFAHTVCKDAALYVDPMDASAIATKIIELSQSNKLQQHLITRGTKRLQSFGTAEGRAKQYLEICQAMLNKSR